MPPSRSRRSVLTLGGTLLGAALAGCVEAGDSAGTTTSRTTATTEATTTTTTKVSTATTTTKVSTTSKKARTHTTTASPCENGGRVVDQFVVEYDTVSGFDLTASKQTIERGEQITFRLKNITDSEQESGVKSMYTIHRETADGWREIFYPSSPHVAYQEPILHQQPGEGFTWKMRFSQSGLAHDIEDGVGSLDVCTPLQPGTYRFVYWGLGWDKENESDSETEYALGVRFSVSDD